MQFLVDSYGVDNCKRFEYDKYPHIGFTDMFFHDHYDHNLVCSIDLIATIMVRVGYETVDEMSPQNTQFPEYFGSNNNDESLDNRYGMSYFLEGVK